MPCLGSPQTGLLLSAEPQVFQGYMLGTQGSSVMTHLELSSKQQTPPKPSMSQEPHHSLYQVIPTAALRSKCDCPILQMRKLRFVEIQCFAQDHKQANGRARSLIILDLKGISKTSPYNNLPLQIRTSKVQRDKMSDLGHRRSHYYTLLQIILNKLQS